MKVLRCLSGACAEKDSPPKTLWMPHFSPMAIKNLLPINFEIRDGEREENPLCLYACESTNTFLKGSNSLERCKARELLGSVHCF